MIKRPISLPRKNQHGCKQWKTKFLEVVNDTKWLANIVPVPKKDGRIRMCVDYQDLNKACLKDDFPLPYIDTLVDSAASMQYTLSWTDSQVITRS